MGSRGGDRNVELPADLGVVGSLANKPQYLLFSLSEPRQPADVRSAADRNGERLQELAKDLWGHDCVAERDDADCIGEPVGRISLTSESGRARI